jgi:activating signal cointegrator complex subunit 1
MPQRRGGPKRPPSQKKPPLTHFLCLPLVTASSKPQLETSIETFRNHVSPDQQPEKQIAPNQPDQSNAATIRIHPKAIRPVGVLHCTLGVMSLDTKEKLEKGLEVLEGLDVKKLFADASAAAASSGTLVESSTTTRLTGTPTTESKNPASPLQINLIGLASMHDPQNTSILYIDPSDATQRLYPFCLALQKIFKEEGVLLPDDRDLRLHATIVNTIYAKGRKRPAPRKEGRVGSSEPSSGPGERDIEDRSQGHGPRANAPLKFDARDLLEEYKDFVWAEDVVLDRIAICEMGAKKRLDGDGNVVGEEYTEVASVGLPVW